MKTYINQEINYDVSGVEATFDSIVCSANEGDISIQFYHSDLNKADHKLVLQESSDNVNFVDSKDQSGSTVEIVIDNTLSNDILRVAKSFNVPYARLKFVEGTTGTGKINNFKIMME